MALVNNLNLKVGKQDFINQINVVEEKMAALHDVIDRYNRAKQNLNQFLESDDSNYEAMIERIDVNVQAAKKAYNALKATKASLQETVDKMENMGTEVKKTITEATEAATSVVKAAIAIEAIDGVL